jgi:MscS family membrane protein
LDNPLKAYVIVVATIPFVIALKRFISRLIGHFLFSFVRKMGSGLDRTDFLKLVVGPIGTFVVVFVSISSIEKLHFPAALEFDIYDVKSTAIVHAIAVITIIMVFIWLQKKASRTSSRRL